MISKYAERKAQNLIALEADGEKVTAIVKRFDPMTGEELDADRTEMDLEDLERQLAMRQAQVAELEAMIADHKALAPKEPKGLKLE